MCDLVKVHIREDSQQRLTVAVEGLLLGEPLNHVSPHHPQTVSQRLGGTYVEVASDMGEARRAVQRRRAIASVRAAGRTGPVLEGLATMLRESNDVSRWGWYSLGINVVLAGINLSVALASGSLAVGAETAHNVVDFLSAVGVLAAVKLATRKSEQFPYGLYKLENIASVVMAGLIFMTGYEIARQALLGSHEAPVAAWWMYLVLALAICIPVVFGHFELKAGRASNSPAIMADAREYRVHALTTSLALVALLTSEVDFPIDRLAALLIVLAIANTGWELLREGLRALLDASLAPEQIDRIRRIIEQNPAVVEARSVIGRNAGRFRFAQAVVVFRISDLSRVEKVSTEIEQEIRRHMPEVERVTIHPHPHQPDELTFAVPLDDDAGTVGEHFGQAARFAVLAVGLSGPTVEDERVVENPHTAGNRGRGIRTAEWLIEQGVDVVLLKDAPSGRGPAYAFHDAGVQVHEIECATLGEARDEILRLAVDRPWQDSSGQDGSA